MTDVKNVMAPIPMSKVLWHETKRAAEAKGMSAAAYVRGALITRLASNGYILPASDDAQIVPVVASVPNVKRFTVDFRSADGTLNTETVVAIDEQDVRNIYENAISIEEVK